MLQGCVSYYTRVDCICVFDVLLVRVFVLVCLFSVHLRMGLPLFVARLRFVLHVCVDCMCDLCSCFVCLFDRVCMLAFPCDRVAYAVVGCNVAYHITRVCRLHVYFAFVF